MDPGLRRDLGTPTQSLADGGDYALNDARCELGSCPMGMTIIEKILARASGAAKVAPGDLAVVDVDLAVLIDLSFSRGSWREVLKVHNPEKVVVVFDHDVPASNRETAAMHVRGRDFVRRFGIRRFHDVGPDQGISHVVVAE